MGFFSMVFTYIGIAAKEIKEVSNKRIVSKRLEILNQLLFTISHLQTLITIYLCLLSIVYCLNSSHLQIYLIELHFHQKLHSYPADLKSIEEWRNVLDQIMWAMNEISKDYPNDPLIRFYNTALTKEKYSHEEEEKTRKESDVYFKRIDNGLLLFTKYLRDLWD